MYIFTYQTCICIILYGEKERGKFRGFSNCVLFHVCKWVCLKFKFLLKLLKWNHWYVFRITLPYKHIWTAWKWGVTMVYRRNKFWTKKVQKGSDWEREDLKKQGCKAIDKVTHQTPGGEGTFRQVLDQATENRKIRQDKDLYEVNCLWSLCESNAIFWVWVLCKLQYSAVSKLPRQVLLKRKNLWVNVYRVCRGSLRCVSCAVSRCVWSGCLCFKELKKSAELRFNSRVCREWVCNVH